MSTYSDRLLKLIVMSDIHLLPRGEVKRGLDTAPRFDAALDSVQAFHMDADLCVFAGDLTEKSDVKAYELFDNLRSRIDLPQRVLLGNHDDRDVYIRCAKEPMQDENGFIEGYEDIKGHRVLMLDSSEPGKTRGGFCDKRLTWVVERLAEAKSAGLKVIILLHHNPCALQMPVDTYRLSEPEKLLAVLHDSKAEIIQIVAGHCHITSAGSWGGYPCATISGNQHRVEPFLRGRSGQQACYEDPAQYAVLLSDGTNCAVHFQNYIDQSTVMDQLLFPAKMNQEFEKLD
ncbi:3',5'-cyclic adenosine monophosphate phosphodiesterase CpdA [Pseudovibrio japonicus]|uniref:3',5'-cyclic adenosine monophosphate phosphodiesterase CpdA n=1 Tax=Pseudovibrio japonicus TaxID=366534 RepID=A0ABQ3ETG2_9HYPH|nr:metallophosphoesterase [Pseudovibrio japonicus]GHB49427.1 3',5'-cyclic adenosine monophosphate phosphodiesterase CpdA [Pseudovibrio japonicus]